MPLVGKIIKKAIDVSDELRTPEDPEIAQQKVLKMLLSKARNTRFGKHYQFDKILDSKSLEKAFAKKVPIHTYEKMYEEWWSKVVDGAPNITWPGKPDYFALSSGTTSNASKRIPVTQEMISAIRKCGIQQVLSLANYDLPESFFEKQILMLGSSTDLEDLNGKQAGEISGISASNIPFWFRGYYKPGEDIASIDDWDERIHKIAIKAPEWDIGALSGIPSWIELMLKEVIKYHKLSNIHEIWPNLSVFTSGGVAYEPYMKSFEKLLGRPLIFIDTYLASEGFLALQKRPGTNAMALVYDDSIYFEFIPFSENNINENGAPLPDAPTLTLAEVEENTDYILLVSTVSGAWRYSIGDTVMITDKSRSEIRITGRTKHFLNVVGSQLSVNKMNAALQEIEKDYNFSVPEFTVAAIRRGDDFIHKWYLGTDDDYTAQNEEIANALDEKLQAANKGYKVARSKALKDVEVEIVPVQFFYDWNEKQKKKGGQVKTPRVMKEEQFSDWESFVHSKVQ